MLQKTDARTLRLLDFADFIENLSDDRIILTIWCLASPDCDTVGCYAGHAIYRYGTKKQIDDMECGFASTWTDESPDASVTGESPRVIAEKLLDLRDNYSPMLFTDLGITKTQAVQALRKWAFE